jgi:molecular chaperone DnaK (HSP70)
MTSDDNRDKGGVRLGVDFGVSMSVIAIAGPGLACHTLEFSGLSREFPTLPGGVPVHGIPSLIGYEGGKAVRSGDEVARGGTADDPSTARWLRHYLCNGSSIRIPAGNGRMVGYEEAAADFLALVLTRALMQYPGAGLVFTLPPDAPPAAYPEFLQRIARTAGAASCAFLDEYSAAAAGYGYSPADGEPFLVVTFAETGLDVTVLAADDRPASSGEGGLRVLAQATGSAGCRALDTWITQGLLAKFRLLESDPRAVRLMPQIRSEAARLREHLPFTGDKEVKLKDTLSGKTFTAIYTTADLDRILADHEVIAALQECIGRALSAMRMRGGDESQVRAVLLLGTGCALPAVQDAVRSRFAGAVVYADHPLDAVARGALEYAAPVRVKDRITCSYALRYWDPAAQEHHYRFLVHSGTRYPSAGQVARIVISAAYDGQSLLGIPLYEIGGDAGGALPRIELVSDTGGGVRIAGPAQDADGKGQVVHANERSPTLLVATPPARRGEPRFECTFTLDTERNLCLSARDLVTGTLVKVNAPVHRLR